MREVSLYHPFICLLEHLGQILGAASHKDESTFYSCLFLYKPFSLGFFSLKISKHVLTLRLLIH